MKRWFVIFILLLGAVIGVAAQESTDPFALYEGIPFGRTADGAFVLGSPDAPITLVEFADFMCPHCQDYHSTITQFIAQYVKTGLARFEYRLYPIVHPTYSVYTAQLAECVEEQLSGGFWPAGDILYGLATAGQIGPDTSNVLGDALGISAEKLDACIETAVQYETDLGVGESMGVSGTPTTLIRNAAGELGWAYFNEQPMNRGGLPLAALEAIVTAENPEEFLLIPRSLLASLVGEDSCDAPCWRDITPGETTFSGLADVIRADRQFYEIGEQTNPEGAQYLTWLSLNSGIEEPNFIASDNEGVVEIISILEFSKLTLGQVLSVQGDPDYALASRNNSGAILYTFFPDRSMVLLTFIGADSELGIDSSVIGAQFFSETRFKDLLTSAVPAEWVGFDGLDTYLQE